MATESEIDVAIAGLVQLWDGKNDALSKLLKPAIRMLKEYRRVRFLWKKSGAELRKLEADTRQATKNIATLRRTMGRR